MACLCSPSILRHSIRRDHHSRAIFSQAAVDENLLPWIFTDNSQELFEYLVLGERAVPPKRDIRHAQLFDQLFVARRSGGIDDDIDPHVREGGKSFSRRLPSAEQRRRNFPEISETIYLQVLSDRQ